MTIYQRIGGSAAVNATVDLFYKKVLADPALTEYFAATDMDHLKAHQRAFITAALGGPAAYAGKMMSAAHAGLGIDKAAFDTVVGHLVATLAELGVEPDQIEAIGNRLAPLQRDIVTVTESVA